MKKNMICIICPKGCSLEADVVGSKITVSGNACTRGAKYALDEIKNPMRTVTAVMRVEGRENTMVSVKTDLPIPKDKIFELMELIKSKKLSAPIENGQVICDNIYGARLVATKNIK